MRWLMEIVDVVYVLVLSAIVTVLLIVALVIACAIMIVVAPFVIVSRVVKLVKHARHDRVPRAKGPNTDGNAPSPTVARPPAVRHGGSNPPTGTKYH